MKKTLDMINRMQADGVIGKYAIGGAVGVIFYLEAFYTTTLMFRRPAHCFCKLTLEPFADL